MYHLTIVGPQGFIAHKTCLATETDILEAWRGLPSHLRVKTKAGRPAEVFLVTYPIVEGEQPHIVEIAGVCMLARVIGCSPLTVGKLLRAVKPASADGVVDPVVFRGFSVQRKVDLLGVSVSDVKVD